MARAQWCLKALCWCFARAETLRNYFCQYGEVVDCVIMKDKTSNQSRGFGFVKFKDPNCVRGVLDTKPHCLDGRNIDPKPCTPRGMQPEKTRTKEGWVLCQDLCSLSGSL
uniref:RRM domain-containing protein n=1 Tax=Knipowitschia caucasica TaxID=637954 RepID=A0AAV2KNC8_KNICA